MMKHKVIWSIIIFFLFVPNTLAFAQDIIPDIPDQIEIIVTDGNPKNPPGFWDVVINLSAPIAAVITALVLAVGGWISLKEFRQKVKQDKKNTQAAHDTHMVKVRAEARLLKTAQIDADIKLMKGFAELLSLLSSSGQHYLSESIVNTMLPTPPQTSSGSTQSKPTDEASPPKSSKDIAARAILYPATTTVETYAYIAAIASLAHKHKILQNAAREVLEARQNELNIDLNNIEPNDTEGVAIRHLMTFINGHLEKWPKQEKSFDQQEPL